ncbi:hypothetical protein B7P43_G08103 [Cryptotermes secundus]|uniref:Uncharacterized protein n=1 Tax=Cryptotermes secundus TaxID=105785 RepID=A0A2J7Q654_9NEOP|nr:hypothetical protein B7P43_G08103 [Cryptotermes secundus]
MARSRFYDYLTSDTAGGGGRRLQHFRGQPKWRGKSRDCNQSRGLDKSAQRPQKVDENPPTVSPKPIVDPTIDLKPKALSTTESALRNDPMWQDFHDDGFNGLSPYFARNEFAVSTEGVVAIAEKEYDLMLMSHPWKLNPKLIYYLQ